MSENACAGALLHAAEAAHNSEPQQYVLQHALQEGHVQQGPPALGPPSPAAPLDVMGCLQQLLQGQQVCFQPDLFLCRATSLDISRRRPVSLHAIGPQLCVL